MLGLAGGKEELGRWVGPRRRGWAGFWAAEKKKKKEEESLGWAEKSWGDGEVLHF